MTRDTIRVSVVIPVWNPGDGILKCIASLRGQTRRDIEMIFVDDRGTDASMDRIRAAAAEDDRIRVLVNPENRGPGYSRNAGIEVARGEYVGFVDPDDYLAFDYLERLYILAVRKNVDIAKGRIVYEKEDGSVADHHEQNDHIRTGLQVGKPIYAVFTYEHHSAIYRRQMLMDAHARYGLARRAQDTTFLLRACHASRSIELDDNAVYFFCERGNSAMHVFDPSSLEQRLFSFQEQVDYLSAELQADPFAPAYTNALFLSNLRFFACYRSTPESEAVLAAYSTGMREQVLRLPYVEKMRNSCFSVRALLDHGVLLPATPGTLPWEHAASSDWLNLLGRWTSYLCDHPDGADQAVNGIAQICIKAESAGAAEGNEKAVHQAVVEKRACLPMGLNARIRLEMVWRRASASLPSSIRKLFGRN